MMDVDRDVVGATRHGDSQATAERTSSNVSNPSRLAISESGSFHFALEYGTKAAGADVLCSLLVIAFAKL
jgi:hypothetical protein